MRNVHSVKGALAMIDCEAEAEAVHGAETFLIESYNVAKFAPGVCDLMIDFWQKLQAGVEAGFPDDTKDYSSFHSCYTCVRNHNYATVCKVHYTSAVTCSDPDVPPEALVANNEKLVRDKIVTVGTCKKLETQLQELKQEFTNFNCLNDLYGNRQVLREAKVIFVDFASVRVNAFLIQEVLSVLRSDIFVVYLLRNRAQLFNLVAGSGRKLFSFGTLSIDSDRFTEELNFYI